MISKAQFDNSFIINKLASLIVSNKLTFQRPNLGGFQHPCLDLHCDILINLFKQVSPFLLIASICLSQVDTRIFSIPGSLQLLIGSQTF